MRRLRLLVCASRQIERNQVSLPEQTLVSFRQQ